MGKKTSQKSLFLLRMTCGFQEKAALTLTIKRMFLPLKKETRSRRLLEQGTGEMSPSSVFLEDSLVPQTLKHFGSACKRARVVSGKFNAKVGRPLAIMTPIPNARIGPSVNGEEC